MRYHRAIICGLLLAVCFEADAASHLRSRRSAPLPPTFEENRGQFREATKYLARGAGYQVSFEPGLARILTGAASPVELSLFNEAVPQGVEPTNSKLNYLLGNDPSKWIHGAEAYRKISYRNPGGSSFLFYWNAAGDLEFDLTLPPHAAAANPAFRLSGTTGVRISPAGDLEIEAGSRTLKLRKPVVYQLNAGIKRIVPCRYSLGSDGVVRFELGDYDRGLTVTIDPTLVVTAGTYLGGSVSDEGYAVTVDSSGNTYIAGSTQSPDFPLTSPFQNSLNGTQNAFIAKLNAAGTAVIFATYLGGSGTDSAKGIGLDGSGNIYVAGTTSSSNFPLMNPAIGTFKVVSGASTGWVAGLNPSGSALVYSTYLGGTGSETIHGLAADTVGNAYVTGGTRSLDFPVLNGYQMSGNSGSNQAFLTKFSKTGTIAYSTVTNAYGGDGVAVAADNSGIAVFTNSVLLAPVQNAYQSQPGGAQDVYVVKVNTTLTGAASLLFATYLGGSGLDQPAAIAMDSSDNVYVAGFTESGNFPILNPYSATPAAGFLTKLAASGSSLIFSTYFGGGGTNIAAIATDASGNVYLTGLDFNSAAFPQLNALAGQSSSGFVSSFSFSGTLIYSSYVGQGGVTPTAIAASAGGNATLTGQASFSLPLTQGAVQSQVNENAGGNAFVLTVQFAQPASLTTSLVTPTQGGNSGFTSVSVSGQNILAGATLSLQSGNSTVAAILSSVSVDGRTINGTFDLRQQPTGAYNVIVTNPDSTTSTLPNAFNVSLGGAPNIYVTVVGSSVLPNRENLINLQVAGSRTLTVIVGNNGNADAFAVPVTAMIGPGVTYKVQSNLVTPPQNAGSPAIDYSQVPIGVSVGTGTLVPLLIPWIPAGGTSYFQLTLNAPLSSPNGFSTTLQISADSPYLMIDPNGTPFSVSTTNTRKNSRSHGPHPDGVLTVQDIIQALVKSKAGFNCLVSVIQAALNFIPGVNCAQEALLIQQTVVMNLASFSAQAYFNTIFYGSAPTAEDTQAPLVQFDVAMLQIILKCSPNINPVTATYFAAISGALALTGAIDNCTKAIVPLIIKLVSSSDPNEKDGPPGIGTPLWISGTAPAPYNILFENLPTATAPAGKVVITDQLNPQIVNLSTFSFGTIGFGSTAVTPTPGATTYSTTVDLRPATNVIVSVNASITGAGLITWTFQSLDPTTGLPITDPEQGFLPPNTAPPNGQGYVFFTVRLNSGLTTNTAVPNQASVVFDNNAAILTNVWQNTIDATPPTSSVTALPTNESSNVFTVNWSGTDVGSGIQNYTIFNSVNGGPFTPWITSTTSTSATCTAAPNSTQAFFAIATDAAGNVQPGKTAADTSTTVANAVAVTIATNPPGLLVSVDSGTAQASPVSVVWQVGSPHSISTPTPQTSAGTQNNWTSWSDSGAASHSVTATVGITTYTASFSTSYLLTTSSNPSQDGTVSVNPAGSSGYYASGTPVTVTAAPNNGYSFSSWTGNVANSSNASTTVTLSQPQTVVANFSASLAQPVDVSSQVKVTGTGLVYNRATGIYTGTVTIVNTGATPIAAPIQSVFTSLISGATLNNQTGTVPSGPYSGAPYITLAGTSPLAFGASVSFSVQFKYTGTAPISYVSKTLSGAL